MANGDGAQFGIRNRVQEPQAKPLKRGAAALRQDQPPLVLFLPTWPVQNAVVADGEPSSMEPRSFLTCAAEVARLLGIDDVATRPNDRRARHLAHAVRKPLLERASLPEELFAPLMAAAVYDPDPSFCRWFVEPAVYAFGRRRVMAALVDYLRIGSDAERAGAIRAWYCAHVPVRADRSPAYGTDGVRDPALDETQDIQDAWLEASKRVSAEASDRCAVASGSVGFPHDE
ncbi:hypothetical protein ABZY31_29010 [Streptomyces sp. NPDC006529]|uniref:hypothetical protein n=1 Tax=Streptomyces sp. NPDC006529 TaxID=3157177 RepID=UPI0033ABB6B6